MGRLSTTECTYLPTWYNLILKIFPTRFTVMRSLHDLPLSSRPRTDGFTSATGNKPSFFTLAAAYFPANMVLTKVSWLWECMRPWLRLSVVPLVSCGVVLTLTISPLLHLSRSQSTVQIAYLDVVHKSVQTLRFQRTTFRDPCFAMGCRLTYHVITSVVSARFTPTNLILASRH